ncbi:MAG TPA: glycosyltransferase family 2 protein [Pyrinomonadaceae bacterium]|jgi:alpha-1,3-rhamnosyltransferase|nr:glycosyltransferase family 2 protein [Pyrinomonadaceae bacterium]
MSGQHPSQAPTERREAARVAVVVPSYNHAPFVAQAVRSVFHQTLRPAELLVIDDGSADDSARVVAEALKDCPFACELIARENRGLCATLNEGLAKTRGDYFAYLGSDDLWLPDFLAARVQALEERARAVLAYGHAFLIDERGAVFDCTADWAAYADGDARAMLLEHAIAPMSPTVLYRRTPLERRGWNERARLEDYELYLLLSADGEFAFDPRVLSAWRRHTSNTSRDFVWMIEARLEAQRGVADELKLSDAELWRYQRALNFAGAEDLLRLGDKARALHFLRRGLGGAPSTAALARVFLRLIAPHSLTRRRKRRTAERAARRYGSPLT